MPAMPRPRAEIGGSDYLLNARNLQNATDRRIFLWYFTSIDGFCFWSEYQVQMAKPKSKAAKKLTKGALIQAILDLMDEGWARKDVKNVLDALTQIGHNELKKRGEFVLPGFAKFLVIKKPARPAREGINPFTKEPTMFAAKPARKVVKARPVKAIKDTIA